MALFPKGNRRIYGRELGELMTCTLADKKRLATQIKAYERQIARQEKIYKEASSAFPMALDPAFCQRVMDASQQTMADLRKKIEGLKKIASGNNGANN